MQAWHEHENTDVTCVWIYIGYIQLSLARYNTLVINTLNPIGSLGFRLQNKPIYLCAAYINIIL